MRYLVQIDGVFYGYDNPYLARIDILTARNQGSEVGMVLMKDDSEKLRNIWQSISEKAIF